MGNRRLFLASASPRRADLLTQYNIPFTKIPNLLEDEVLTSGPTTMRYKCRELAKQKAMCSASVHQGLVLACDTIVVIGNTALGKPRDATEAEAMLNRLSGNTHRVISAFCIIDTIRNTVVTRSDQTRITFQPLNQHQIRNYIATCQPFDKAGSYGIQELDDHFIATIDGHKDTVIGLPMAPLLQILRKYDIV